MMHFCFVFFQECSNLRTLSLAGCTSIMMLPDSIRHLSRLQVLSLGGCWNLQELPSSIGQLSTLQQLNVVNCRSLGALPDTITALPGLQELGIRGCSSMSNLPTGMGLMRGLTLLDMDVAAEWRAAALGHFNPCLNNLVITKCTDESRAVLDSLGALRTLAQLSTFSIRYSACLTKAPETIGVLTNLVLLRFQDCEKLRELPNSIGELKVLMELAVIGCSSLETLPDSLGEFTSLRLLMIVQCTCITKLPTSIGQLSGLWELELQGCSGLQALPDSLKPAKCVAVSSSTGMWQPGGFGLVESVARASHLGCTSVTELPGSCLLVMVDDHPDWVGYYGFEEGLIVRGEMRELRRLEKNDCGYLRLVGEAKSGRTMVQRVHQWPCMKVE